MTDLVFHHIGLIVNSIEDSLENYSLLFGKENISSVHNVTSQRVKVCFIKIGESSYIELVAPASEDSVISTLLKKKTTYYHIGYKVPNIEKAVNQLEELHYKALDYFDSEAFNGKKCIFLFTPQMHLMELIEA